MCRLFALRSRVPVSVHESLVTGTHSLEKQSCCDTRCERHEDGWGIGFYVNDEVCRVRSVRSAAADPNYARLAESIRSEMVLAHVRQASMGPVLEKNCHPFSHGRWLFAHNGTLAGFPRVREQLFQSLPERFQASVEGETDSELAFYVLLAGLEDAAGTRDPHPRALCQVMAQTIGMLADLCPGDANDPSRFNFVLTDGQRLLASRWGHSLHWLKRQDGAIAIASEPTTPESWSELPDRSLFWVDGELNHGLEMLEGA